MISFLVIAIPIIVVKVVSNSDFFETRYLLNISIRSYIRYPVVRTYILSYCTIRGTQCYDASIFDY